VSVRLLIAADPGAEVGRVSARLSIAAEVCL
jgi:hypothetical protein